ncbi:MAG TPA: hypothetical protein VH442_06345, partial [Micromonosporaceae bacterium]
MSSGSSGAPGASTPSVDAGVSASEGHATDEALGTSKARAAEANEYLAAVRAALSDLDPTVRDGLLEDLPAHLDEVAAADTRPLRDSIGPSTTYAAELRSAAGLAPGPAVITVDRDDSVSAAELAREYFRRVLRGFASVCGYDTPRELSDELRPAWWVLRGAGIAAFLLIVTGLMPPWYASGPVTYALIVLAFLGAVVSIRLGRAWQRTPAGRQVATVVNVACLIPVLYAMGTLIFG